MAEMWVHEMVERLKAVPDAGRKAVIDGYIALSGKSRQTLYRKAAEHGFNSQRKARADKGTRKCGLTDGQLTFVAGILKKTGRENKGPIMPIDVAMEIAVDNGYIEAGQASTATVARHLREMQLSKERMKDPAPHTEMASKHPNYCHLVDVSVCIQYYLRNGRMGIMDERDFYKNKPDAFVKIKQKLMRYVLTDHLSGFFCFRYYIADGESKENLQDFLVWCWKAKEDQRYAFHGVPFYLLMDTGSAQTSHAMQNFFDGLVIIRPKGRPYNPRRQGAVEGTHTIIENRFETRLRICPAFDVDQLNGWAFDWTIGMAATRIHSRHGETRNTSWLRIKAEELRILPDAEMLQLIYVERDVECTVRNYLFNYRGQSYRVKHLPGIHHNAKVKVTANPYQFKTTGAVTVTWQEIAYEVISVKNLPAAQGGFSEHAAMIGVEYKDQPMTATQRGLEKIEEMAHGEGKVKKNAIPFEGLTVFGHQADKLGNLTAIPKRGLPMEISRSSAPRMIAIGAFINNVRMERGQVEPALNRELKEIYGATIAAPEAERVIAALRSGEDWRPGSAVCVAL